jgi:transposase
MGYREKGRMEIVELIRRWQAGETERAIARQTSMARATVGKYLTAAQALGLERGGVPPVWWTVSIRPRRLAAPPRMRPG